MLVRFSVYPAKREVAGMTTIEVTRRFDALVGEVRDWTALESAIVTLGEAEAEKRKTSVVVWVAKADRTARKFPHFDAVASKMSSRLFEYGAEPEHVELARDAAEAAAERANEYALEGVTNFRREA